MASLVEWRWASRPLGRRVAGDAVDLGREGGRIDRARRRRRAALHLWWSSRRAPTWYAARMMKTTVALMLILSAALPAAADMLKVGDPFPSWALVDQTGATRSSRDLAGKKYLIWFYPKAMTPGCTAEGQGLRDRFNSFQTQKVEIIGVSFDAPAANAEFVKTERFPFTLLSDRERTLAVAVGAADSPEQPVARRISYLVGPDGKVLQVYATVNPASHAQDVLNDLK
jgi:peroxiredoxin Q/BCP